MFVGQFVTNIKKGNHACVYVGGGGAKYHLPPTPEIKLNKMKKIAQPTEFRLKYAKNTKIHLYMYIKTFV